MSSLNLNKLGADREIFRHRKKKLRIQQISGYVWINRHPRSVFLMARVIEFNGEKSFCPIYRLLGKTAESSNSS